jgi:hypothetical protein
METQRVNGYRNRNGLVFYIEQYNPEQRTWYTVGDTYEKLEYATAQVEHYNLVELLHIIGGLEVA